MENEKYNPNKFRRLGPDDITKFGDVYLATVHGFGLVVNPLPIHEIGIPASKTRSGYALRRVRKQ